MTKKQLEKLGKIINLMKPSGNMNMVIYIHQVSKNQARNIMRRIPKGFRKATKITDSGCNWKEATKHNVYGLSKLEVTAFYPKEKEG